jgi:hypothetical protein
VKYHSFFNTSILITILKAAKKVSSKLIPLLKLQPIVFGHSRPKRLLNIKRSLLGYVMSDTQTLTILWLKILYLKYTVQVSTLLRISWKPEFLTYLIYFLVLILMFFVDFYTAVLIKINGSYFFLLQVRLFIFTLRHSGFFSDDNFFVPLAILCTSFNHLFMVSDESINHRSFLKSGYAN